MSKTYETFMRKLRKDMMNKKYSFRQVDSALTNWLERRTGSNVRISNLKPGTWYIMRVRTIAHQMNYSNPYTLVYYLGYGPDTGFNKPKLHKGKLPSLKELEEKDWYVWLKQYSERDKGTFIFGAYPFRGSLCIASGAIPISFYKFNNIGTLKEEYPTNNNIRRIW